MRTAKPSATAQNIALARSHLTWMGILDDPWAETMLRPRWAAMGKALRVFAGWGRNSAFTYVGLGTRSRGSRPALMSRLALALQGEPITFQPPPEDAPDLITATG